MKKTRGKTLAKQPGTGASLKSRGERAARGNYSLDALDVKQATPQKPTWVWVAGRRTKYPRRSLLNL